MKAAGSLPADLSLARKKSDPAEGIESDKAADESGRFAPSGLVAGSEEKRPCRRDKERQDRGLIGKRQGRG
ncbi:MAG: hypothetical protein COV79_04830 [Parcubacteria group bacterium CG11_big_fil_rev_8_21_14_0_20_41_14]|nr:MAG: hypothetical protein COV79_04830 [Parcubacteria group bacterium CG11_big_fil_rev_8_21_14_0_20_41_14]